MSRETRFATRPRRALGTEEATDMAEASLDRRHSVSRVPAVLVGLGGLVFIAGIAFPVVGEVFSHLDDPAAIQAAIEADPVSWDVAAGLTGVGALITALGLFLLGRGLAAVTQRPRPRAAAAAGGWLGLGVAAWVAVALYRVLASPSVIAENQNLYSGWDLAVGAIWFLGVLGSFVAFGLALVWLRHLRILGWLMIAGGTLLAVVGVILPVIPFFGYAGAGIALSIAPPRDHAPD
jgi:hypothetical protein